jgi:hypothetical protein
MRMPTDTTGRRPRGRPMAERPRVPLTITLDGRLNAILVRKLKADRKARSHYIEALIRADLGLDGEVDGNGART